VAIVSCFNEGKVSCLSWESNPHRRTPEPVDFLADISQFGIFLCCKTSTLAVGRRFSDKVVLVINHL